MTYRIVLRSLVVLVALVAVCFSPGIAHSQVRVQGHYRKNGTYVRPHYRSRPDGNFSNNWSTKGNFNPYTGKEGTRVTPPTGYGSYSSGISHSSGHSLSGGTTEYRSSDWLDNPYYTGPTPILQTQTDPTDERLREIASTDYHGVGFSTTHQQFLRRFPNAKPAASPDSSGVISYAIDDVDGKRDTVWFQFFDDEFLCLGFTYHVDRIRKYGGVAALLAKAKLRFGPPTKEDEAITAWHFPTIDRSIRGGRDGANWCLLITRDSVQDKVNRRKMRSKPEAIGAISSPQVAGQANAATILSDSDTSRGRRSQSKSTSRPDKVHTQTTSAERVGRGFAKRVAADVVEATREIAITNNTSLLGDVQERALGEIQQAFLKELDASIGPDYHRTITAEEFGRNWPFQVRKGELVRIKDSDAVIFIVLNGNYTTYAISATAIALPNNPPLPDSKVWRKDPATGNPMSLYPLVTEGMKLGSQQPRSESVTEHDAKSPDSVHAPSSIESSVPPVEQHELETGFAYFVSKQTSLMTEPSPIHPSHTLGEARVIPRAGGFLVQDSREVEGVRWYHVTAINSSRRIIGDGWISSIALLGQDLNRIDGMDFVTAGHEGEPAPRQQPSGPTTHKSDTAAGYKGFAEPELQRLYGKLLRAGRSPEEAILQTKAMLDYPDTRAFARKWLDSH